MFLGDSAIRHALRNGSLVVAREDGKASTGVKVQPSSVELHLGDEFKWWSAGGEIDPLDPPQMFSAKPTQHGQDWYLLEPHGFALGHTVETVGVDSTLAAQVDGKSSLARLGLQVHMTSGFIDPGFKGQVTLEFYNASPKAIRLRPGMVIAQLFVIPIWGPVERPYGSAGIDSRYQGQTGAQSSLYGAGRVEPCHDCGMGYSCAKHDPRPEPGTCQRCGHGPHANRVCGYTAGEAMCNCGVDLGLGEPSRDPFACNRRGCSCGVPNAHDDAMIGGVAYPATYQQECPDPRCREGHTYLLGCKLAR